MEQYRRRGSKNQDIPFQRITLDELQDSNFDWQKIFDGLEGKTAVADSKNPFEHQKKAVEAARKYFATNERGKMIMACGTGKTYTLQIIVEDFLGGKGIALFMVSSIALLGQTLNAWCADARKPIKAACICSDSRASRKIQKR